MPQQDLAKAKSWKEKFENYQSSGLSQSAWCKENNEKLYLFRYWREKLKRRDTPCVQFEELQDSGDSIEIHKITIRLPTGFDQKTLKDCLVALQKESC